MFIDGCRILLILLGLPWQVVTTTIGMEGMGIKDYHAPGSAVRKKCVWYERLFGT
jgi:hypothetical protein